MAHAQQWLKSHSTSIPALECNLKPILNFLKLGNKSHEIAQCAESDAGLTLALLEKVNSNRVANSDRDIVDSTRAAIALLGQPFTYTLFKQFDMAETLLKDPQQLFLFHQILNRSYHNACQIGEWARENGHQQIQQLKISALLYYSGEALCCLHDYYTYLDYIYAGSGTESEIQIFGFYFSELTEIFAEKLHLPELLTRSQLHNDEPDHRLKLLRLVSNLCRQCEHGWYHSRILNAFEEFADYLEIPLEKTVSKFHLFSVLAAHQSCLPDTWQPASRLILSADSAWIPSAPIAQKEAHTAVEKASMPPTPLSGVEKKPVPATPQAPASLEKDDEQNPDQQPRATSATIFERIKQQVQQPGITQSAILHSSLDGLTQDLGWKRSCLLLLSKDKQNLHNRMSAGIPKDASLHDYQIQIADSGLFKILINKPLAIWINPDNIQKYHKLIPKSLLDSSGTEDFVAMSLFIAEKPIGIIYADRHTALTGIDEGAFSQFKQLILLTSKALGLLVRK
jgi:HD-like signal output (HDOD) protein